ncbi:hypothetical protein [Salibacterium aidingense]|uniref:hypothetical protein n=1 Tax=Salibacterium aidingense TaxID=384933 RepID=UPI003BBEAE67
MVWITAPWLFYLLYSIVILAVTFLLGIGLHALVQRKNNGEKKIERLSAFGLAVVMAVVYWYGAELFTDRASAGERVVTSHDMVEVEKAQVVVVPFGEYAVIERLYDFGFTIEDRMNGERQQITFDINNGRLFMEEYADYIEGNGVFVNEGRIAFQKLYENEWKQEIHHSPNTENMELPGVNVEITPVSS